MRTAIYQEETYRFGVGDEDPVVRTREIDEWQLKGMLDFYSECVETSLERVSDSKAGIFTSELPGDNGETAYRHYDDTGSIWHLSVVKHTGYAEV